MILTKEQIHHQEQNLEFQPHGYLMTGGRYNGQRSPCPICLTEPTNTVLWADRATNDDGDFLRHNNIIYALKSGLRFQRETPLYWRPLGSAYTEAIQLFIKRLSGAEVWGWRMQEQMLDQCTMNKSTAIKDVYNDDNGVERKGKLYILSILDHNYYSRRKTV
ncbi:hypothetical protein D9C73_013426 [Collichthys lucidus]|uniref:Uncharacterized protein n=1 Tax=Collichthys lucidus TaxID=240159 RepID=A0A4U5UZU8_COLLU|nr:hypothetical protein D9C73_013426 [Collichthys lucidus]